MCISIPERTRSRASLLSLTAELRLRIYRFVLGATTGEPQWPCCFVHFQEQDWHFAEALPTSPKKLRPVGLASFSSLLSVNRQIYSEALPVLHPALQANFCISDSNHQTHPAFFAMGDRFLTEPDEPVDVRLSNIVSMVSKVQLDIWTSNPSKVSRRGIEYTYPELSKLLRKNFFFQDNLRAFVRTLNSSRNLRLVTVRYFFDVEYLDRHAMDGLHQLKQLRNGIRLNVKLCNAYDDQKQSFSYSVPMTQFLQRLQGQRSVVFEQPGTDLRRHWASLRNWIIEAFPFLGTDEDAVEYSERRTALTYGSDAENIETELQSALEQAWKAHDCGLLNDFNDAKRRVVNVFNEHNALTLKMLDDDDLSD